VDEARGLRARDRRFTAAADELLIRAALLEVASVLDGEGPTVDACRAVDRLIDDADGHLNVALEAGLDDDLARADRRRLGRTRERVEADCGTVRDSSGGVR